MVGQRIKAYLDENGIKKTFLCEKTGLSNPIMTEILSGRRRIEVMEYCRICQALKVDFMTFIVEEPTEA